MLDWVRETITVVAKTYPECSKKYGCLVCTAGINEQGAWRRLYPIPWALFWGGKAPKLGYKKFDIISIPVRRASHDHRMESYTVNPFTIEEKLKIEGHIKEWEDRRKIVEPYVDPNLEILRDSERSLGIIKPKIIHDFLQKDRQRLRDPDEVLTIEKIEQAQQLLLPNIEPELLQKSRTPPESLPWIGYSFLCQGPNCKGHEMMCIDWEIQQLFRRYRNKGEAGFVKVRDKAMMAERDLHFVVGTTWRFPSWMIIGLFYPPKET